MKDAISVLSLIAMGFTVAAWIRLRMELSAERRRIMRSCSS